MTITEMQMLLKNLGWDPGKIDGVMGPNTERALIDYAKYTLSNPTLPITQPASTDIDNETKLLIDELYEDEGEVLHAYKDSLGYLTIGIGRLIDKRKGGGITKEESRYLKMNDVVKIKKQLSDNLYWTNNLDSARRRALLNMTFQLGISGLLQFQPTLDLIRQGKYKEAGTRLRKSLWYKQTPNRAERVIKMIETGENR